MHVRDRGRAAGRDVDFCGQVARGLGSRPQRKREVPASVSTGLHRAAGVLPDVVRLGNKGGTIDAVGAHPCQQVRPFAGNKRIKFHANGGAEVLGHWHVGERTGQAARSPNDDRTCHGRSAIGCTDGPTAQEKKVRGSPAGTFAVIVRLLGPQHLIGCSVGSQATTGN